MTQRIRIASLLTVTALLLLCRTGQNTAPLRADPGVFYVDGEAGDDANPGTLERPWRTLGRVSGRSFAPGDRIRFKRGAVWDGESLIIGSAGTAALPIVYEAYGTGDPPQIQNGGISLGGAQHIILRDLEISGSPYAGIALQEGTQFTEIAGNILHHNAAGIWLGNGVGMNNRIVGNTIYLNNGNGIAVDAVFCTPGNETRIAYNEIYSNTWHGIELSGNYHIVEGNIVHGNGANPDGSDDLVGHSGIHLFSRYHDNDPDLGGDHNIIRNNIVYGTRDRNDNATDGNGIQMDMWCDDNLVYNNIVYRNDGPGIIIFGGSRNRIAHNTLYENGRYLGFRPARTQLMVASSEEVDAADNILINNIAFSTAAETYAAFIGDTAAARNNLFSHNLYFNAADGNLVGRGSAGSLSLEEWNAASWADDLAGNPLFVDAAARDFHLAPPSPAVDAGQVVSWVETDSDGDPRPCPADGGYDIGADEACPLWSIFLPWIAH